MNDISDAYNRKKLLKKQQADVDLPAVLMNSGEKMKIDVFLDCIYKKTE